MHAIASWLFYAIFPLIAVLLGTIGTIFGVLALPQAARKRAAPFLKWLVPAVVGTVIQLVAFTVLTFLEILRYRGVDTYILLSALQLLGSFIGIFGAFRMWQMIKDNRVVPPATLERDASAVGGWPPAPLQ